MIVVELAWPDAGPDYEWYREFQIAGLEEPPAVIPARTITAAARPVRCKGCRYLKTWCCCPGGPRA